jgi:glutaminyl-peptide cyclotransferase
MVPDPYFAEGLCMHGNKLFQLTWLDGVGFIYDAKTLQKTGYVPMCEGFH